MTGFALNAMTTANGLNGRMTSTPFVFDNVVTAICDKMVRRHPHVFGDASFADAEAQTVNWEAIKAAER